MSLSNQSTKAFSGDYPSVVTKYICCLKNSSIYSSNLPSQILPLATSYLPPYLLAWLAVLIPGKSYAYCILLFETIWSHYQRSVLLNSLEICIDNSSLVECWLLFEINVWPKYDFCKTEQPWLEFKKIYKKKREGETYISPDFGYSKLTFTGKWFCCYCCFHLLL